MKEMPALQIAHLTVNYQQSAVLWDISFDIPDGGNIVAIVGPNGAGKSTLIKAAMGLIKPISGKISFFGLPLSKMRNRISYVPQRESVDWDFPITVLELVAMGLYGRLGLFKRLSRKDLQLALEHLKQVGMESFADRQISQLSGGQQQRVFIARALIQQADLYFMDEPFTGIDATSAQVIWGLLRSLKEQGKTVCVVHHDLSNVCELFDWTVLLNTRLVACGTVKEMFTSERIEQTYGKDHFLFDQAIQMTHNKKKGLPG